MGTEVEFPTAAEYSPGTDHKDSSRSISRTPLSRDQNNTTWQSPARFGKDVTMIRSPWFARQRAIILSLGLLIAVTCLTPPPASTQTGTNALQQEAERIHRNQSGTYENTAPALSDKQKRIMQANYEKSKHDAAELAALAKELREELNKPNVNGLSAEIVNRAEKIRKLAKKIRGETDVY